MIKNIQAILLGLTIVIISITLLEFFFSINKKFNFISNQISIKNLLVAQISTINFLPKNEVNFLSTLKQNLKPFSISDSLVEEKFFFSSTKPIDANRPKLFWSKNTSLRHKKFIKENGTIIYDVNYHMNSYARRIHNKNRKINKSSKGLILLGGSFAFGQGLDSNETLPYYLEDIIPNLIVYPYSRPGWGPNDILSNLRNKKNPINLNIHRPTKTAIYYLIGTHIDRLFASSTHTSEWILEKDYYDFNEKGELTNFGPFQKSRKITNIIYTLFNKSNTVDFLKMKLPILTDNKISLFINVLNSIKKELETKYQVKNFYILYKVVKNNTQEHKIYNALKEEKFNLLDLIEYDFDQILKDNMYIPYEAHPSKYFNKLLASIIKYKLKGKL